MEATGQASRREFLQKRFKSQKRQSALWKHHFLETYSRYLNVIAWFCQRQEIKKKSLNFLLVLRCSRVDSKL